MRVQARLMHRIVKEVGYSIASSPPRPLLDQLQLEEEKPLPWKQEGASG